MKNNLKINVDKNQQSCYIVTMSGNQTIKTIRAGRKLEGTQYPLATPFVSSGLRVEGGMSWKNNFLIVSFFVILYSLICFYALPADYTDEHIVNAIYKAEGAEKAKKPFGILSVSCEGYDDCRQICFNTVRNNRKRYADYGYKQYDTYLEFLASRYAPIGASNDPHNLNQNWLKNVRYFLKQESGK
jgi:hypothetical protein